VDRNHAWEEQAKSLIKDVILCEIPTRESEAYRSFAYLGCRVPDISNPEVTEKLPKG